MKFDTKNWGTAKAMPVTMVAGQTARMPRHPQNATSSQNGTSTEKNGNCRPTMADKAMAS